MKVRKGDFVLVVKGKYKGKTGKVLKAFPKDQKIIVEGVNIVKKHRRSKKQDKKGEIIELFAPLWVSNVKIICPKCKKPTKIGYRIEITEKTKKKKRICKKCQKEID